MNYKRYTQKKKRLTIPSVVGKLKTVRIDARTQIMVSASIPDEVARANFIERIGRAIKPCYVPVSPNYPVASGFKEIPIGDMEDMVELIESTKEEEQE